MLNVLFQGEKRTPQFWSEPAREIDETCDLLVAESSVEAVERIGCLVGSRNNLQHNISRHDRDIANLNRTVDPDHQVGAVCLRPEITDHDIPLRINRQVAVKVAQCSPDHGTIAGLGPNRGAQVIPHMGCIQYGFANIGYIYVPFLKLVDSPGILSPASSVFCSLRLNETVKIRTKWQEMNR